MMIKKLTKMLFLCFVLQSLLIGCASTSKDSGSTDFQKALVKKKVMGHWKTEAGSTLSFWCNGAVNVDIQNSDVGLFATNTYMHDHWSGSMTRGSAKVVGFDEHSLTVHDLYNDHHWHVQSFPDLRAGQSHYALEIENLTFYAGPNDLSSCE
ncbi:MAG: hypothetical protein H7333_02130 [Bdellovibrionales bacterium]|nr:hypothetical protein [Oligoflexia bacterium]